MKDSHRQGQPLRFLLVVALFWIGGRLAALQEWSGATALQAGNKRPSQQVHVSQRRALPASRASTDTPHAAASAVRWTGWQGRNRAIHLVLSRDVKSQNIPYPQARPEADREAKPASFTAAPLMSSSVIGGRWSASSWIFWRNAGGQNSLASVGQLGGSQAGLRLAYQLVPDAPEKIALYGRMTSALRRPNAPEAAIGISTQPMVDVPLRIAVERRVALDRNARNAMAVMAVGGIGPLPVAGGFILEGYGQAGIVGVRSRDVFADGKVTVMHSVHPTFPISAGLSLSGGAQPRVSRIDIGPQIESRLKIGEQSARISAEWRYRAAGNARPGSGLAITLATDF